ncbi:hypothetical protein [Terrabacter sp. NPDC000476]|uniref:hypothetical protein n=1 Tax=Terrabacter sp. NPDC000476 TaxID=3154258 RepID=UPI0033190FBA
MSDTTPQQHYAEAERLMDESDTAYEEGKYSESEVLVAAATARATLALAAAVSEIAKHLAPRDIKARPGTPR